MVCFVVLSLFCKLGVFCFYCLSPVCLPVVLLMLPYLSRPPTIPQIFRPVAHFLLEILHEEGRTGDTRPTDPQVSV